jgi:POT family proton-dependent oligopeptide transporter
MPEPKTFFGHPRGLTTLFFTELWERFSYYGMRALLLLFMVATVEEGGMGLELKTAGPIYGLYTMFVYLLAVPGGWLADRYFGLRKAVFYGGCLIAAGNLILALPYNNTFFIGLILIVIGTGLLKPNISSMVGELYPTDQQAKRDAGFTIFYMGINIGAFISPLITGYLGEKINWHYGFAVAGLGMLIGLVQYKMNQDQLGTAGLEPTKLSDPLLQTKRERNIRNVLWGCIGLLIVFITMLMTGTIAINPSVIANSGIYVIGGTAILYFAYILIFEDLDRAERFKIATIAVFFVASATFYAGYEQQGSTLNIFAKNYTDMFIGSFEMPASWMQAVPPICVVIFAPIFAWLWIWLSKRKMNPGTPVKLAFGLLFMGLGYLVMMGASSIVIGGGKALPTWLIATYVFHTFGEICLYPVGLSAVTKLSPKRLVGQMMGIWFMSLALGNLIAGVFSGEFEADAITANPQLLVDLFWIVVKAMFVAGIIVLIISKPIRKWMGDIR